MAWSAAFVVTCVRSVEIVHGIADEDWLLYRHHAHYKYAYQASLKPSNRYQTIELTEKVEKGDIIVQDRNPKAQAVALKLKDESAITHGDIVVDVEDDHVTTVGGNVEFEPDFDQSGSVRKREYRLQKNGALIREKNIYFKQEKDDGAIVELRKNYLTHTLVDDHRAEGSPYALQPLNEKNAKEKKRDLPSHALHPQSTSRIFALLRLIDDCKPRT